MGPDFQFLRAHEVKKSPGAVHDMIFGTWTAPYKNFALGFFVFPRWAWKYGVFSRGPVRLAERNVSKKREHKVVCWTGMSNLFCLTCFLDV